jgi:hypothetical protein
MIAKNKPSFERIPRTRKEAEAAQRLVNTVPPTLDALERAAHRPLYTLFADQLAGDGRGQLKVRLLPWEGFPIQEEGEANKDFNARVDSFLSTTSAQPFRVQLVDALNFMPCREEWDVPYVIEQGWRSTPKTLERFGLAYDGAKHLHTQKTLPKGKSYAQLTMPSGVGPTIPVEEIWTEDTVYLRINGTLEDGEPNGVHPLRLADGRAD